MMSLFHRSSRCRALNVGSHFGTQLGYISSGRVPEVARKDQYLLALALSSPAVLSSPTFGPLDGGPLSREQIDIKCAEPLGLSHDPRMPNLQIPGARDSTHWRCYWLPLPQRMATSRLPTLSLQKPRQRTTSEINGRLRSTRRRYEPEPDEWPLIITDDLY